MEEFAGSNFTAFDIVVFAVITLSALMSVSRGLVREASSLISFAAACAVAFFLWFYAHGFARSMAPDNFVYVGDIVLILMGFLTTYFCASWLGTQLARFIHSSPQIGFLDRLSGAIFGALRGVLAILLAVILMQLIIPRESTPAFIANSKTYPYADKLAQSVADALPGAIKNAKELAQPLE